jgi:SAM-dependent methyltransferase
MGGVFAMSQPVWSTKPSPLVKDYFHLAATGAALDLGMGEGGNALFLARQGFSVTALDRSADQLERAARLAHKHDLQIDFKQADIRGVRLLRRKYALVWALYVFPFITKSELQGLSARILNSLAAGGILIAGAFTVEDPFCRKLRRRRAPSTERNTFLLPNAATYSFFERRELLEYFPGLRIHYYGENDFYDTGHGQPHWHGLVELVGRKA